MPAPALRVRSNVNVRSPTRGKNSEPMTAMAPPRGTRTPPQVGERRGPRHLDACDRVAAVAILSRSTDNDVLRVQHAHHVQHTELRKRSSLCTAGRLTRGSAQSTSGRTNWLAIGVGAIRFASGVSFLVAPEAANRLWGDNEDSGPTASLLLRSMGYRDALIGGLLLRSGVRCDANTAGWFLASAGADAADLIGGVANHGRMSRRSQQLRGPRWCRCRDRNRRCSEPPALGLADRRPASRARCARRTEHDERGERRPRAELHRPIDRITAPRAAERRVRGRARTRTPRRGTRLARPRARRAATAVRPWRWARPTPDTTAST